MRDSLPDGPDLYMGIPIAAAADALRDLERLVWSQRPQVAIVAGARQAGILLYLRDRLFDAQHYRSGPAPRVVATDGDPDAHRVALRGLPPEATAAISWETRPTIRDGERVLLVLDVEGAAETTAILEAHRSELGRDGAIYLLRADGPAAARWRADDAIGRRFVPDGAALVRSDAT